jgi:hypothetical protein
LRVRQSLTSIPWWHLWWMVQEELSLAARVRNTEGKKG